MEIGKAREGASVESAMLARVHDYASTLAILPDAVSLG
jgi:hypothetical protein